MKTPTLTRVIEAVVIFIAAGSFIISYNNLHESALQMGIPPVFAVIFPITIDAFLLVSTLFVLYAGQKGVSSVEGWTFLIIYTFASIAFNIHMAPKDIWSQAGFAMCPIGLCVALHFLMRILEIEMVYEVSIPVVTCEEKVEQVEEKPVSESLIEYKQAKKSERMEAVREYYKLNPRSTYADATKATGISYKTLKAYKEEIDAEEMHV